MDNELHVLLVSEDNHWTAVGLEHAVFAWGDSLEIVVDRFAATLCLELAEATKRGETGLESIPPAPELYREKAKTARRLAEPIEVSTPTPIPNAVLSVPHKRSFVLVTEFPAQSGM